MLNEAFLKKGGVGKDQAELYMHGPRLSSSDF